MIVLRFPSRLGVDARTEWVEIGVDYRAGASLAEYLSAVISIDALHHVIINGRSMAPDDNVVIEAPHWRITRIIRKGLRIQPKHIEIPAYRAFIPPDTTTIIVIPKVGFGKNTPLIFGIIGGIVTAAFIPTSLSLFQEFLLGYTVGSTIGSLVAPGPKRIKNKDDGPSTYVWGGATNERRAGVAEPILLGERIVGGVVIGDARRRPHTVPVRAAAGVYDDTDAFNESERLEFLLLVAGHRTQGPVGITNPNLDVNATTNKPDIRINGQHYSNFGGITVDWRTGEPGQTVIPGFEVSALTYDINFDLTAAASAYVYVTVSDQVDAFEVLLNFPGLFHGDDAGNVKQNTTRYVLQYRRHGTSTWLNADYDVDRTITGSSRSALRETRRVDKNPDGTPLVRDRYDIQIQWSTASFTDPDKDAWHIELSGVTEETNEALNHEGKSLIAVLGMATDQTGGGQPVVTSLQRGYIPRTWDGGWSDPGWGVGDPAPVGRNRAWLSLALGMDAEIGAGTEIGEAHLVLPAWKAWADHCAELETVTKVGEDGSPIGDPYTEPRHQLDAYLDQGTNILDLWRDHLFPPGRAALLNLGGKYSVGVDRPSDPTQWFGMGSIVAENGADSFQLTFKSERKQQNTLDITFDDRDNDFLSDVITVAMDNRDQVLDGDGNPTHDGGGWFTKADGSVITEDDLVDLGLPVLRQATQFFGVSRRSENVREARYRARQKYALREVGQLVGSTGSIAAEPYDTVGVAHDLPQYGYSGNCADGATNTLVLFDRAVPFEPGTTYAVRVRFAEPGDDGKPFYEERDVADTAPPPDGSSYFGVTVTLPFSRVPEYGDEWWYGPKGNLGKVYRMPEITREANHRRTVQLVDYNESVYDTSGPIVIKDPSLLSDFGAPPPAITEAEIHEEHPLQGDGSYPGIIVVSWIPPAPQRGKGTYKNARVERSWDGATSWELCPGGPFVREFREQGRDTGEHVWFRITPLSIRGVPNAGGAKIVDIVLAGKTTKPPVVTGWAGSVSDGTFLFSCDPLAIDDPQRQVQLEVRDHDPSNWKTDTTGFLVRVKGHEYQIDDPEQRSYTLYVRWVDAWGNYSVGSANATVTDAAPAVPTLGTITHFKNGFKIPVTPPALTPDVFALHLHASQTSGFTPSPLNRVDSIVGNSPNEFTFQTNLSGTWYFKAAAEDWLSEKLGDYVYTAQVSAHILVVVPVDPSAVTVAVSQGNDHVIEHPTRNGDSLQPQPRWHVDVAWTWSDSVNPAQSQHGFHVIVMEIGGDPTKPLASVITPDASVRSWRFSNTSLVGIDDIVAGVDVVYDDGVTSNMVTSLGETILEPTNPRIRDFDDHTIARFQEGFDPDNIVGAALPAGISVNPSLNYAILQEATTLDYFLSISPNGTAGVPVVKWALSVWAAAYLDTSRGGKAPVFLVRCKIVTPSDYTGDGVTTGISLLAGITPSGTTNIFPPVVNDGEYHTYRLTCPDLPTPVPAGYLLWFGIGAGSLPIGSEVHVTSMALAFENVDNTLDGNLDKALKVRDLFAKDPSGGGFFGEFPLRNSDDVGNITIVNENGIQWLRHDGVNEVPLKRVRNGLLSRVNNDAFIAWEDSLSGFLNPPMPTPIADSKAHMWLSLAKTTAASMAPPYYPAKQYTEITDVNMAGFRINSGVFFGGNFTDDVFTIASGDLSATPTPGSSTDMTLNSDSSPAVNGGEDAWISNAGRGFPTTASAIFYRWVFWISIHAPTALKTNGGAYWMDVDIVVNNCLSGSITNANPFRSSSGNSRGPHRTRIFTDGKVWRRSIVYSNLAFQAPEDFKFNWTALTRETGCPIISPSRVWVDEEDVHHWEDVSVPGSAAMVPAQDFNIIHTEEF